jgi:hypothetical protein
MKNIPPDKINWQPLTAEEIQHHLGSFNAWCLCGGQSLDWMVGRTTRQHGDTDIGVFRSDLETCLKALGLQRVFLAFKGHLGPWDGKDVPGSIHDIWITDPIGQFWMFQIMVFDDVKDKVVYRRDPRIQWNKTSHFIECRGLKILNPFITLLFKLNRAELAEKDCRDIQMLIEEKTANDD